MSVENGPWPILAERTPLIAAEAALVGPDPQKILDELIRRRLAGKASKLVLMGGNGSGKTRRASEIFAHLTYYLPEDDNCWWGREEEGLRNIYYNPLEQAQKAARKDLKKVHGTPGLQTDWEYEKNSVVLMYASAQALRIGGLVVSEGQGFCNRATDDYRWTARRQHLYQDLDYEDFYWLSTGNEEIFKQELLVRQARQDKIGLSAGKALEKARGGVRFSMDSYYRDEVAYFVSIIEEIDWERKSGIDKWPAEFSLKHILDWRKDQFTKGKAIFLQDFDYRKRFMRDCLPCFYFEQELGLDPWAVEQRVCITEMPVVKPAEDYGYLLDKYDLLAKLREKRHLKRKIGRIPVLRPVEALLPKEDLGFTPIENFNQPITL